VSRWHQRLDELRAAHGEAASVAHAGAANSVQNVQNPALGPCFEHSEQIEQPDIVQEASSPAIERVATAWGEAEEERAAHVEYDGDIPRQWAEGLARLDADRPPADVPLRRWQRFVDDAGLFLDSPFRAVAAALGWGPYDLFGCDRDRPFARIDQAGLLWLLDGNRLVMLAADAATIATRAGERQTWRRKPSAPGRVLAWELAPRTTEGLPAR
jgi:hypothetical protein